MYPKLESNLIPTVTWILSRHLGSRLHIIYCFLSLFWGLYLGDSLLKFISLKTSYLFTKGISGSNNFFNYCFCVYRHTHKSNNRGKRRKSVWYLTCQSYHTCQRICVETHANNLQTKTRARAHTHRRTSMRSRDVCWVTMLNHVIHAKTTHEYPTPTVLRVVSPCHTHTHINTPIHTRARTHTQNSHMQHTHTHTTHSFSPPPSLSSSVCLSVCLSLSLSHTTLPPPTCAHNYMAEEKPRNLRLCTHTQDTHKPTCTHTPGPK